MPKSDGSLTIEEQEKISKWFEEHWPANPCPVCGGEHWKLADRLYSLHAYVPGTALVLPGRIMPNVVAICSMCAYTRLFNAIAIGVVTSQREEDGGD